MAPSWWNWTLSYQKNNFLTFWPLKRGQRKNFIVDISWQGTHYGGLVSHFNQPILLLHGEIEGLFFRKTTFWPFDLQKEVKGKILLLIKTEQVHIMGGWSHILISKYCSFMVKSKAYFSEKILFDLLTLEKRSKVKFYYWFKLTRYALWGVRLTF
jgi:hypothetical protein